MSTFENSTMCYHFHFLGMNYLTKYIDHRTIESILGFIISFAVLFSLYTGLYKGLKTALLPKELYKSGRSSQFLKKLTIFCSLPSESSTCSGSESERVYDANSNSFRTILNILNKKMNNC